MKPFHIKLFCSLTLGSVLIALAGPGTAHAIHFLCYVNPSAAGLNNGSSWANAYTDLQTGLGGGCAEIWVVAGTYKPTNSTDRTASFNVAAGTAVYGGFAGTETQRSQRDPAAHVTILSGDIGTLADNSDNSYHVVSLNGTSSAVTSSTVLDGFTVTAGNANGSPPSDVGGGLYCNGSGSGGQCSPTLKNLTFTGNIAQFGGAIYNNGEGTGVASPTIANVTFSGNIATFDGGAIYNDGFGGTSSPTLTNDTLSGNQATNSGGAIYNDGDGGASSPTLENLTFNGNTAQNGGAIYDNGSGGGTSTPTLTNVILWGNTATSSGPEIHNNTATPTISYSVVQGSGGSGGLWDSTLGTDGGHNLAADPVLGLLQKNGGSTQTMALGTGSSAIDTGYYFACPATDQRGYARLLDGFCDIGAYEFLFTDVADSYWAASWIYRLYGAGITGGCSATPLDYCPLNNVSRDQMAVFLEKGIHYPAGYTPPAVPLTFTDTSTDFARYWIEALKSDGITSGCGTNIYCPSANVTRAEMAVFLLRAEHGSSYTPPAATGTVFADVSISYWAAASIEQLYHEGITGGCSAAPLNYCPDSAVTRDQMAVFLVKVFALP